MKKITALLLAIVATAALAIGMAGCSGGTTATSEPTPSTAVSGLFDALKAQDAEAFAKSYAGEAPESLDFKAMMEKNEAYASMTDEQKAMIESFINKVLDFDYAVGNEQVDGDAATVDVTFTTYDFGSTVETLMSTVMTQYMSMATSGEEMDESAATQAALDSMQGVLDGLTEKSASATVTMNVSKDADGNWKVDEFTDEAQIKEFGDALLGGLVTKMEGLMETFGSSLGDMGSALGDTALGSSAEADKAA